MRVIFFFINSALLTMHFVLTAMVLQGLLPLSTKTQESNLYGSTLLEVEFSSVSDAFTNLYGFPLVLMLALVLGIYSRKDNKLDRKFFFSKKGFLFNALFAILMFVISLVLMETSSSFDRTAYAESELERLYVDKKTDLNTLIAFEPDETPTSFESRLIASQDIQIQQILNTSFDHKCGWQEEVSPRRSNNQLLIVPVNQIKSTVDLFKSDYSIDKFSCELLIDERRRRAEKEKRAREAAYEERWKERRDECLKKSRNRALCNAITNQQLGN